MRIDDFNFQKFEIEKRGRARGLSWEFMADLWQASQYTLETYRIAINDHVILRDLRIVIQSHNVRRLIVTEATLDALCRVVTTNEINVEGRRIFGIAYQISNEIRGEFNYELA